MYCKSFDDVKNLQIDRGDVIHFQNEDFINDLFNRHTISIVGIQCGKGKGILSTFVHLKQVVFPENVLKYSINVHPSHQEPGVIKQEQRILFRFVTPVNCTETKHRGVPGSFINSWENTKVKKYQNRPGVLS